MTFVDVLEAAKDTTDAQAYVSRVKAAVMRELRELDSSVVIEDTDYFNHTAIPDLVLSWPKERSRRSVFLRHSYESVVASDDAHYLADADPVVLSLNTRPRSYYGDQQLWPEVLQRQASASPRLLLTDPQAIEVIGTQSSGASPLADLVRANFIRGGRGLIDRPRATTLASLGEVPGDADNHDATSTAELIRQSFSEDAAARITRTAQLIALALRPAASLDASEDGFLIGGRLSVAELRHLVPWLLKQERAITNARFWAYLGDLVSFADLENIRGDLAGLDLTPLIAANAEKWSAKWAYVGVSVPIEGDNTYLLRSNFWSFLGSRAIGIDIGDQRLSIAHNGQLAGKGRDGTSTATWDRVRGALASDRLARVDLRGITRSVILHAERSPDIRADIQKVTESLDDNYTVNEVVLRTPAPQGEEGTTDVEVKYDNAILTAPSGASILTLARAAMQVLNYRAPATDEQLTALFTVMRDTDEVH